MTLVGESSIAVCVGVAHVQFDRCLLTQDLVFRLHLR